MDPVSLVIFVVLLLILIFFAGTEIPLMSVSDHIIESAIKHHRFGASTLKQIKRHNERLLMTNLIGTTAVTIAISSFSTIVALDLSEQLHFPGEFGLTLAMLGVSTIILLIGEIAPKILGVRFLNDVAFAIAPIYSGLMILLFPLNWLIEYFVRFLSFITGAQIDIHSKKMTSEEFEAFIDISREKGGVEDDEHKKIKSILDLSDTEAFSVMTPRVSVDFAKIDMTVDELCQQLMDSSHTRLPVCGDDTDDVDYVVTFREAFTWQQQGLGSKKLSELDLEKIIKVPLTKRIDRVFEIFQKSRKHIALVLDEHGGVAGIITLEDIIEEVFGDIKDENDREDVYIRRCSDGSLMIKGNVVVDDLLDEFNLEHQDIHLDEEYLGETVGYLIISMLERFPVNDEVIELHGKKNTLSLTVKEVADGRIEDVYVQNIPKI